MKYTTILIATIIFGSVAVSCNRKTAPSFSEGKGKSSYDVATFDFLYTEGIRQKLMGNAGDALKYLEKCVEMNPQSDASYHQMAQISLQLGNTGQAKKYAINSQELDDRNIWYMTFLGGIYYQERNLDSALIYFEKAGKIYPDNTDLKITLSSIYTERGDYNKANEIYRYFIDKYGENENISMMMVKNMMNTGDLDGAETIISELLIESPEEILYNGILAEIYRKKGKNEKAEEVYKKLLDLDSTNPQTLLSLSDFMIAEKKYDDLFVLLNTIAINEKITMENKISLLSKLIDTEDIVKNKGGELEITLKIFEEAEKNKDIISLMRPELYQKMGRKEDAIIRLEEIIKMNPNIYFAWEKLLILYSDTRNFDKLYIRGKECATRFNMSYPAKVLYASGAMEKKLYDEALEELRKARIIAGSEKEMLIQVVTMEADIYYRKGEYQKSFSLFKEALDNNPDDMTVLNNYAYYLAEQNQNINEAEKMIRKVIEKEKENNTFLDTYAWVLFKGGKKREAIKIMEDIMARDNKPDADWYEHYGYMMKSVKKCNVAVDYWKKALELEPERIELINAIENCKK